MKSKTCIYDNPETMCREHWRDGVLEKSISVVMLYDANYQGKFEPWVPGFVEGNKQAMKKKIFVDERHEPKRPPKRTELYLKEIRTDGYMLTIEFYLKEDEVFERVPTNIYHSKDLQFFKLGNLFSRRMEARVGGYIVFHLRYQLLMEFKPNKNTRLSLHFEENLGLIIDEKNDLMYAPFKMPTINKKFPKLIAQDFIDVQPMAKPTK